VLRLEHAGFRPRNARAGWQEPVDISLEVRAGEIVGLAGIMGRAAPELLTALYGAAGPGAWSGMVEIDGEPAHLSSIRGARGEGLGLVNRRPARQRADAARQRGRNLVLTVLRRVSPFFLMSRAREVSLAREAIHGFDVRPPLPRFPSARSPAAIRQKVVLARKSPGDLGSCSR